MHRQIIGVTGRTEVDHINGDRLDNRRSNLRAATRQQNSWNSGAQRRRSRTSRYKGVSFDKSRGLWTAHILNKNLGRFDTEEEAALTYDKAATELFGEFAYLNLPNG